MGSRTSEDTLQAIVKALQKNGLRPRDVFIHADPDHRRGPLLLSRRQFDNVLSQTLVEPPISTDEADRVFKFLDKDKNNYLNRREFCGELDNLMRATNASRADEVGGERTPGASASAAHSRPGHVAGGHDGKSTHRGGGVSDGEAGTGAGVGIGTRAREPGSTHAPLHTGVTTSGGSSSSSTSPAATTTVGRSSVAMRPRISDGDGSRVRASGVGVAGSATRSSSSGRGAGSMTSGGASRSRARSESPACRDLHGLGELVLTSLGEHRGSGRMLLRDGSYDWIRKENAARDRELRREAARQTRSACEHGGYTLDGRRIAISHIEDMLGGTRIVRFEDVKSASEGSRAAKTRWSRFAPGLALAVATNRAQQGHKVGVVSAASAYHAGGGFFSGGRHALEESICTQTTLAKSLQVAQELAKRLRIAAPRCARPARPPGKTAWECHIPEDGVVFSPFVEIFRGSTGDGYPFLQEPVVLTAIVSIAMPNANDMVGDAPVDMPERADYLSMISKKFHTLASVCVEAGVTHLVMVDAGCGAYGNNPMDVGYTFGKVIHESFRDAFDEILLVGGQRFTDAAESSAHCRDVGPPPDDDEDPRRRLEQTFQRFDLDQDGVISREELAQVLQTLDEDTWDDTNVEHLMNCIDVNGDGYIGFDTFLKWLSMPVDVYDDVAKDFVDIMGLS